MVVDGSNDLDDNLWKGIPLQKSFEKVDVQSALVQFGNDTK